MAALRRALIGIRQNLNTMVMRNPSISIVSIGSQTVLSGGSSLVGYGASSPARTSRGSITRGNLVSQKKKKKKIGSQTSHRTQIGSIYRFPSSSQSFNVDLSNEENKRQTLNRLLYRSRQSGYLELDLILGNWVEENISSMDESGIRALVDVLNLENPDLWKWLIGQEQPPENVNSNPVFCAVHDKVLGNLNTHTSPETRTTLGNPWVRGWDDIKKGRDGPVYGNQ